MKYQISNWFATCSYIGYMPFAPGTWGSVAAIPFLIFLRGSLGLYIVVLLALFVGGIWSSKIVSDQTGVKDPQRIVIDETCGMFVSFLFIPVRWQTLIVGFLLFRAFDITKPPPVRNIEKLPHGFGIVMDDVLAGVYANLILQILIRYAHL